VRAIIVGIDGLIGRALADALLARGDTVFGTTRRPEQVAPGKVGLLDLARANASIEFPEADVAFFCAAITNLADCRMHPELAERVNFRKPVELAGELLRRGMRTVFLSTNAVFDGRTPAMSAEAVKAPNSFYGRLKSAAEDALLSAPPGATVVRLTKILVPTLPLLARWNGALRRGAPIEATTDHRISPLSLGHGVDALLAIADLGGTGVYQVSAKGDVSYEEIALKLAIRLGANSSLVVGRRAVDIGIPREDVMPFTSLDTSRLTALTGLAPPDAHEVVDRVLAAYTP
jgi:dTDP-4-dehydrorhamnose reductase